MKKTVKKEEYHSPECEYFRMTHDGPLAQSAQPGFNPPFNGETNW